ncbi:MAG: hypothetical protein B6D55_04135 [Candidatus Omnitrophica bacterium 4484_70.2]|nr:MAG: hypothetical protein B6D55_04135 [Candidatus Omnitrophica bacterium 4484_70.2]
MKRRYLEEFTEKATKNIAILDTIRRMGPISKMDISKIIGVNPVTVSNYIERFIKEKLVVETSFDESKGGRRPLLLDLNKEAGYAIGVGVNLFNVVGVITDMEGRIVYKTKIDKDNISSREVINIIVQILENIFKDNVHIEDKIKGIGIGIAGIIDKERDLVRWPQKIEDEYLYETLSFPLREYIERKFNTFTVVENDATCACFAEYWLSLSSDIKNIVYMFSGVGAGILINGEIYTGSSGCAGELSIYSPKEKDGFECKRGNPCFLRRWEQDLGIVDDFKQNLLKGAYSKILDNIHSPQDVEKIDLKTIFSLAREDDVLANKVLREAGERLGIKIAFIVNFLNPQVVIIGGGIEEAGSIFMDAVRKTVKEWTFEESSKDLRIVVSSLGEDSVALGGASLIVKYVFARS